MKRKFDDSSEAPPPAASSSSSNSSDDFSYDVFISFRGEDTRKGFAGHLYAAFRRCGVRAFFDQVELDKGEGIEEIFTAIARSAVYVPVFSSRFAESRWCLAEIEEMVKFDGRLVLPIFFDIGPKDVRRQSGSFLEAFKKHERQEDVAKIREWREALKKVADLSGYVLQSSYNG